MHELFLVQALLVQLKELCEEHGRSKVSMVTVSIGKESCVVPDSFAFLFDAVKAEEECATGALLRIEEGEGRDLILLRVELEEADRSV